MGCHSFQSSDGRVTGHICLANIYEFEGLVFEYHSYLGPCQYKKDLSGPRENISKNFWEVIAKFEKLPKDERDKYLIYS